MSIESEQREILAQALEWLKDTKSEYPIIKSSDISSDYRRILIRKGFIRKIIKGWYMRSIPSESDGETTPWYTSYWDFCAEYLNSRFNQDWFLSPEGSLLIHTGNLTVPKQLLVRAPKAGNNTIKLPHDTSLLEIKSELPDDRDRASIRGLQILSVPFALVNCSPSFFVNNATDARAALGMPSDASEIISVLLDKKRPVVAGRLVGALKNIGRMSMANDIVSAMQSLGVRVVESDPFESKPPVILKSYGSASPHSNRLRLTWHSMRDQVVDNFPKSHGIPEDAEAYLAHIDDVYVNDAYNSLSIEGYKVSSELIERVRSGDWNPDGRDFDKQERDALAARGYWQSFQVVKHSVKRILNGEDAGDVADQDHPAWYRESFGPSVTAGIIRMEDLYGYRNDQVYIRGSKHVPPNKDAVRDIMPVLFDLLRKEPEPAVRAVLGHFAFVNIHPYMDGNGRTGRFLMNVMLASGGYPWTIVPVEKRNAYMSALEAASTEQDIAPFTRFIAGLVKDDLKREAANETRRRPRP